MGWFSKKKKTRATQATSGGRSQATTVRRESVYDDLSLNRPGLTPRTAAFETAPSPPPRRTTRWKVGKMWSDFKDATPAIDYDYAEIRAAQRQALEANSVVWANQSGMAATRSGPRPPATNRHWAPSESSSSRSSQYSSVNTGSLRSWLKRYADGYADSAQQQPPAASATPRVPSRKVYETGGHSRPQNLQSRSGPFFSSSTRAPKTGATSKAPPSARSYSTVRPKQSSMPPSRDRVAVSNSPPTSTPPRSVSHAKSKTQMSSTGGYHSPHRTFNSAASSNPRTKPRKPSSGYSYAFV